MGRDSKTRIGMLLASGLLTVSILFQAMASFGIRFGPIEKDPFLWPFLGYPMYSTSRAKGQEIPSGVLVGVLSDSSEVEIGPGDFGMNIWHFRQTVHRAIVRCEIEKLDTYLPLYARLHKHRLIGLRLEDRPIVLTDNGFEFAPIRVVQAVSFEPNGCIR